MKNLGYNSREIVKKGSQGNYQYDNEHSNVKKSDVSVLSNSRLRKEDKAIRNPTRTVWQDKGWRIESGSRISRRQVSLGRTDGGTDNKSTQEDAFVRYYLGDGNDTVPAIDREARVNTIIALAEGLQSVAQSSMEYEALERYKNNASELVVQYDRLSKLTAEYRDLNNASERDVEKIKSIRQELRKCNNDIDIYESGLKSSRASEPIRDMITRSIRRQGDEISRTKHQYYDRQKQRTQIRKNTETKNKTLKEIKKLRNRLNNPTKSRNVVNGMQEFASRALSLADAVFSGATNVVLSELNIESLSESEEIALGKYRALVSRRAELQSKYDELKGADEDTAGVEAELESVQGEITELDRGELKAVFERERRGLYKKRSGDLFSELQKAYAELKDSQDVNVKAAFDQNVHDHLTTLASQAGNVLVSDMNGTQLEALYRAYKMINHVINDANKLYINGRKVEASEYAGKIVEEIRRSGRSGMKEKWSEDLKKYGIDELKPVYAFRYLGSETLMELYENLRQGEETWARDVDEAAAFVRDVRRRHGAKNWDVEEQFVYRLESGEYITLTLEHLMSIYAYSRRPQAIDHMTTGGFKFLTTDKVKVKHEGTSENAIIRKLQTRTTEHYRTEEHTYIFSENDIKGILDEYLDDNKRSYVEEMQTYLSEVMGVKGNEVSRALYGIDIYNEEHYFPLMSAKDYIQQSMVTLEQSSLKNSGMTKATVPDANNPIILQNFSDVWSGHVNKMSTYHSFVLGIETMNRVLGYNVIDGEKNYSMDSVITSNFGTAIYDYIKQLVTDVNGGVHSGGVTSGLMKAFSLFKKNAVAASVSVVVQQPTAIIRAMAYIDPKYFKKGTFKLNLDDRWDELKQYAPIAIIKDIGGFDTYNSGKQATRYVMAEQYGTEGSLFDKTKDKVKGFVKDEAYRDEAFMWAAGKADQIGWLAIWEAAKAETSEQTDLEGEELLEVAGRRFTEVVELTQVYDSVFSRSGFMRDKSDLAKMATAFMGEPTTSINMLFDAGLRFLRGEIDAKECTKITGSVVVASLAASLLKSLWTVGRDDERDEPYLEKLLETFISNASSDLFIPNMLPFVKDVFSVIDGWDVPRSDMELVTNVKDAIMGLFNENKSIYRQIEDVGGALAAFFGIPVKNIMRDIRTLCNNFVSMFNGAMPSGEGLLQAFVEGATDNTFHDIMRWLHNATREKHSTKQIEGALELLDAAAEANGSKISNINPDKDPPKYFEIKNDRYDLTRKEQDMWYTVRSENAAQLYGEMLDSILYDTLSDDDKYNAMKLIFSYSNYLAKMDYCERKGIEYSDSKLEGYREKLDAGYSIAQLMWEKYTFDEPKMRQHDKLRAISDSSMSLSDQLKHVYQLVTYENDEGELVTTKYDNIKAATDAGVPLTLVSSMMTYFANVEPIKDSKGKTVKYQGSDGATAKTKAELMEEWLDTTGHERYNGTMVRITDTMRHYMYAIMYPNSKNPFKVK